MLNFIKTRFSEKNTFIYLFIGFMKNNLMEQDIHAFFQLAPDAREKRINTLDLEDQIRLALLSPWERRHEIIHASNRAPDIVKAFPAQELFWTVKALGPEDSGIILNLATPEQLQFFFDLDWWHKDDIRPEKAIAWLLILFECSKQGFGTWLEWILEKDLWLMASVLSRFVTVIKRPDEMDIQEAKDVLPPFTMDNVYYLGFKNQKLAPLMASLVGKILEISPGYYRDVMETVLGETPSSNLETAYRLRCGRLQDHGIPDYYESLDIYLPLEPEQMHRLETRALEDMAVLEELPAFVPTLYLTDLPVLEDAVMNLAGNRIMERIIRETTGVTNKVLMADLIDLDDPRAMRQGIEKTFTMLNLGLEYLAEKWSLSAKDVLASCFLEEIVRVSSSLLLPISTMAMEISKKPASAFLPYEARDQIKAALRRPAMSYSSKTSTEDPIKSLAQLEQCRQKIEKAVQWCTVIENLSSEFRSWRKDIKWKNTNFLAMEEFNAEAAVCTAVCNLLQGKGLQVKPLSRQDVFFIAREIRTLEHNQVARQVISTLKTERHCQSSAREMAGIESLIARTIEECFHEIMQTDMSNAENLRFLKTVLVEIKDGS